MPINESWHAAHRLPRNATHAERVQWHRAHQKACGCRPVPASLRDEVGAAKRPAAKPKKKRRA